MAWISRIATAAMAVLVNSTLCPAMAIAMPSFSCELIAAILARRSSMGEHGFCHRLAGRGPSRPRPNAANPRPAGRRCAARGPARHLDGKGDRGGEDIPLDLLRHVREDLRSHRHGH